MVLRVSESKIRKHFSIQIPPQNLGKMTSGMHFGHSKVVFRLFYTFCTLYTKSWLVMSKLKKLSQGLAGFGCNLAQLIAYLCRSYSPVGTQIQQRQQSKVWHFTLQPAERKKPFLGCKDSNQKCLSYDDKTGFHATKHYLA